MGVYSLYEKLNQAFPDVLIESCTGGEAHLSTMSAHVSAVPNHQVARVTSLDMRKDVAMFGVFGYELNPLALTEEKKKL